jgi:hypothetical protein
MNPSLTRDVEPITDWTDLPRFDRSSEIPVTSLSDSMAIDDAAHDLLRDLITPDSRLAVVVLAVKTYQPANEKPRLEIIQLRTHHKIVIFKVQL